MKKYLLSNGDELDVPLEHEAKFFADLKKNNLTATLISPKPGKQKGSMNNVELNQSANLSKKNQNQKNTESNLGDGSSELSQNKPVYAIGGKDLKNQFPVSREKLISNLNDPNFIQKINNGDINISVQNDDDIAERLMEINNQAPVDEFPTITSDITRKDESNAVAMLSELYDGWGFTFEGTGNLLSDKITITAANKDKKEFKIDALTLSQDKKTAKEITDWMNGVGEDGSSRKASKEDRLNYLKPNVKLDDLKSQERELYQLEEDISAGNYKNRLLEFKTSAINSGKRLDELEKEIESIYNAEYKSNNEINLANILLEKKHEEYKAIKKSHDKTISDWEEVGNKYSELVDDLNIKSLLINQDVERYNNQGVDPNKVKLEKKKKADLQKNERDFAMDYLLNPQFDEDTPFIEKAIRTVYSWQPEWFVSWGASIANRTMDMGLGIIDAVQSEKMAKGLMQGYTKEEMIEEGILFDSRAFDLVQAELNRFARKEYDEKTGDELNVVDLIDRGRYGDAGGLAAEQAISNIYSFLAAAANPFLGAGVISTSVYGQEFVSNMERQDMTTIDKEGMSNIRENALYKASAEFIGEYIGARLWRGAAGLTKKGATEELVKEYDRGFINRFVRGFAGGFAGEFGAEFLTNNLQQVADQYVYGDEKTFKDYFRGGINDGLIGGLLGGPLAGTTRGFSPPSNSDVYSALASRQWQFEMADLNDKINKAKQEASNSKNPRTKELLKKRVDILNKKKKAKQRQINSIFDNMTSAELIEHAKTIDQRNKLYDIVSDTDLSVETRDEAKETILQLNAKLNHETDGFVDEAIEYRIGEILKAREIIEERKGIRGFGSDLTIKWLRTDKDVENAIKESGVEGVSTSDGMFMDGDKKTIYINERVAAQTGQTNVLGHELLHYIMSKNFKTDNESMRPMVDAFKKYLNESKEGKRILNRIETKMINNGYFNLNGTIKENYLEEYFEMFSDLVNKNMVPMPSDATGGGLAKSFNDFLIGFGFKTVKLNNGKDVFEFIRSYSKNVNRKGLLGEITKRGVTRVKLETDIEGVEKADKKTKQTQKPSRSTVDLDVGKETLDKKIDSYTNNAKTKSEFQKPGGGFDNVYSGILEGKFDKIFARDTSREERDIMRQELADRLINFDPAKTPELSKWLYGGKGKGGNIEFARREAKKELAIEGEKRKKELRIDAQRSTEEGGRGFDIVDTTEPIDLDTPSEEKTKRQLKLREVLGLDDKMINKVREAVVKAFRTKLPDVDSKDFKKALEAAFRIELFKPIKNMLGTSKNYDNFLKNNFEAVYDLIPIKTLIKLEKEVGGKKDIEKGYNNAKRIFIREIEKNIKPTRVDDLIGDGILPKDTPRTSGPSLFEKLPYPGESKVIAFFKGENAIEELGYKRAPSTIGTRKDALATSIAEELGFDATMEVVQDPDVQQRRQDILDLEGKKVLDNDIALIAKQIDRSPNVKFSSSQFILDADFLDNEIIEHGIDNIIVDGKLIEGYPSIPQFTVDFIVDLHAKGVIIEREALAFKQGIYKSKVVPEALIDVYKKVGNLKNNTDVLNQLHKDSSVIAKILGPEIMNAIGYEILGYKNRVMDPAKKKLDGSKGEFYDRLQKLKESVNKKNVKLPPGLNLKDVNIMNIGVAGSLFKDINKILNEDISREDKIEKLKKLQPKIDAANIANIKLAKHIAKTIINLARNNKIDFISALNILQAQTSIVQGFRGLSRLDLIDIRSKSQKANNKNPLYRKALKYYNGDIEKTLKQLSPKGEHLAPNSNTMLKIAELMFDNSADIDSELDEAFKGHSQLLTSKYITDIIDTKGGKNNTGDFKRVKFLSNNDISNISSASGRNYQDVLGDVEIDAARVKIIKDLKVNSTKPIVLKKAHNTINKFSKSGETRGMSTFDFDETVGVSENFVFAKKGKETKKIASSEWPFVGDQLTKEGWEFDFSDFNKVTKGKPGPLLEKMKNQIKKYGPSNVFILTARAPQSQKAIHDWLKSEGVNIPIENITGLGNSTGEAKAEWMLEKFAEGYNDMYFVDDALPNVRAVREVLDQLDIKSKVVQAKTKVKVGGFLVDVTTKEGRDFIKQYNEIQTVSTTDPHLANKKIKFSRNADKIADEFVDRFTKWKKGPGKTFYEEMQKIPTVSSSEFKRMGGWIINTNTKEGKEIVRELENIPTVSSTEPGRITKFSNSKSTEFNEILEQVKGIPTSKIFSTQEARKIGIGKGKNIFKNFFVPPSAEDFKGLLYRFIGRGEQGNAHALFFKENLLDPFAEASRDWNTYKQAMSNDYKALKKQFKGVRKILDKKVKGTVFTNDNAIRVYLWNKAGFEIPGLSESQKEKLVSHVENNSELKNFADGLGVISRVAEGYIEPNNFWAIESIASDLSNIVRKIGRKDFFAEWIQNKNLIFSPENLNKIEAIYGTSFRNELEKMLYRMETGQNRTTGKDDQVNMFLDWINGSVGAVMFFNMRSATLQTISMANFINMADNNPVAAAAAFANMPQYIKDFVYIFNSDMLKQRRAGLQIDVSASELTRAFKDGKSKPQAIIHYLLEKGFTPTQIADSFAIAAGGATFYRNRLNKYIKEGMSKTKAKEQAWLDFQEIAEETQQSSRPDLISNQQAGPLGRLILAWQNTPMQMTRLMKKKMADFVNRRRIPGYTQFQSDMANISGIAYYGLIQNIYFGALQTGLMFMLFGWDEDEERKEKLEKRVANGALDSILRGTGIYGAAVSTLKNVLLKWKEEREKPGWRREDMNIAQELVNLSPPMGTKMRKIMGAIKTEKWNKGVSKEIGFRIENPNLSIAANWTEALTNLPVARLIDKANNIEEAVTGNHQTWQRVALLSGWSKWSLGVVDEELEKAKTAVKEKREAEKKAIRDAKKEEKKKQKEIEEKEAKKKEEQEKKEKGIKTVRCSGRNSSGKRCGLTTETSKKTWKCFHHSEFKDGMDRDGDGKKEYRCVGIKKDGKRCNNKGEYGKDKLCYAHK